MSKNHRICVCPTERKNEPIVITINTGKCCKNSPTCKAQKENEGPNAAPNSKGTRITKVKPNTNEKKLNEIKGKHQRPQFDQVHSESDVSSNRKLENAHGTPMDPELIAKLLKI